MENFILSKPKKDPLDRDLLFWQRGKGVLYSISEELSTQFQDLLIRKHCNKYKYALNTFIFNMFCAYLNSERYGNETVVAISLDMHDYSIPKRYGYKDIGYIFIKEIIYRAEHLNYIRIQRGFKGFTRNFRTVLILKSKLISIFSTIDNPEIINYINSGVVQLRDSEDVLIDFRDSKRLLKWTKNLKRINRANIQKYSYLKLVQKGDINFIRIFDTNPTILTLPPYHFFDRVDTTSGPLGIHLGPYPYPFLFYPFLTYGSNKLTTQVTENKGEFCPIDNGYQQAILIQKIYVFNRTSISSDNFEFNRIFNRNFHRNGRFYAGYQNMLREERYSLRIDTKETVELDYKSLHPRIAYNLDQIECPDVYYDDIIPREAMKKAVFIIFNAKGRKGIHSALKEELEEDGIELPEGITPSYVINKIIKNNQQIKTYFFSDTGSKFMFKDSQMAEEIMLHFAKLDKPCLSVHDSFIVKEQDEDELRYVMIDIYKKHFKYDIKIDKK